MNEVWNGNVSGLKNGSLRERWPSLPCPDLQWKISIPPSLSSASMVNPILSSWKWYMPFWWVLILKNPLHLWLFFLNLGNEKCMRGWRGMGEGQGWMHSICPNQGHGLDFNSHFGISILASHRYWTELRTLSFLKHRLLLASRTPYPASQSFSFPHWISKCWRAQGLSPGLFSICIPSLPPGDPIYSTGFKYHLYAAFSCPALTSEIHVHLPQSSPGCLNASKPTRAKVGSLLFPSHKWLSSLVFPFQKMAPLIVQAQNCLASQSVSKSCIVYS